MKKILLLFCLSLFICQSSAQNLEPISVIGGNYYQGDIKLRYRNIRKIVEYIPPAYQEVVIGNTLVICAYIMEVFGVIYIGSGVGSLVYGNTSSSDLDDPLILNPLPKIGVGVAMGIAGIALGKSGAIRIDNGVNIYNSTISSRYDPDGVSVNFGLSDHGIGLTVRF